MNEIVNKFLLAGNKLMHLRQPDLHTVLVVHLVKTKACFQHDMAYADFEDLNKRTFADKVLRDKELNVVKDPK